FLRAVEHDLQANFQKDDDIITATHPEQLNTVATFLAGELSHGFDLRNPAPDHTVLSICSDVLRLPERNGEANCDQPSSAAQFRQILFSPVNAVYQEDGSYLGQAIPFRLTPELAMQGLPGFTTRCAERLTAVDARFDGTFTQVLPIKMAKRETFYSETCSDHVV